MKKLSITLVLLFFLFNIHAQIAFEKGYFIDNEGKKTECLIKNLDWDTNPEKIEYKLSEETAVLKATIIEIKEFGVSDVIKFRRFIAEIEVSSEDLEFLSKSRRPKFKSETVFLKLLVEGSTSLYGYHQNGLVRYFYKKEGSTIQPLINKKFLTSENKVAINDSYKQQLWNEFKCDQILVGKVEAVQYKQKSLTEFFIQYNKCLGSESVSFLGRQKRNLFSLNLRAGLTTSNFILTRSSNISITRTVDYENQLNFRIGLEAELYLPFKKGRWSLTLEPTYRSYSKEIEQSNGVITRTVGVNYKSIELPLGIRYYIFLNNNSRLFINAAYVLDLTTAKSEVTTLFDFQVIPFSIESSANNFAFGIGYSHKSRYSLEARYGFSSETFREDARWSYTYSKASIVFGYSLIRASN